ncbi:MAG: glycosyltransferase family 2 protein [Candidatus Hodarchaeota archaeon]
MENTYDLSVCIVNYNNKNELIICIESVINGIKRLKGEIIVYDNNSSDKSAEMIIENFPSVRLIKSFENVGLARAANEILKIAKGKFILLLDSDTEVKAEAIYNIVNFLRDNNDVGVVGARIYNSDNSVQQTARRFPNLLSGLFGRRAFITRIFPNNPISKYFLCADYINSTQPFEVDYVSAACMLFRREIVTEIGGFDNDYFVYWVDVDWCRRVKNKGYKVFYVPSAKVIHYERFQPKRKKSPKMIKDFNCGAYLYYQKHHVKDPLSLKNLMAITVLLIRTKLCLFLNIFKKTG